MSKFKKLHGNYLGIVVQNNDPQRRGRVKIYVPQISPTSYVGWINSVNDKKYKFIGKNINSSLNDIIEDLKKILPWADCASPIAGESSSGRFNYIKNEGSISDTARLDTFRPTDEKNAEHGNQNIDNIGEKPGKVYEAQEFKLNDAFNNPSMYHTNIVNKYSYNYVPNTYSNKAKGSFSVPNVGSHVWVFFNSGDIMKPVYFAASFGKEDWKGVYDSYNEVGEDAPGQDYPGTFENYSLSGKEIFDINVNTYRNKYIINQKGGTLEFVNTDNREALKLSHYSGSFKEFNNFTTTEFAANNDQKLIQKDQFLTVNGFKNLYVSRDYDSVVRGDLYKKVGNLDYVPHVEYKQILREIAKYKQLFETQRTEYSKKGFLDLSSPYQNKNGTPAPCPVCSDNKFLYYKVNSIFSFAGTGETTSLADSPWSRFGIPIIVPFGIDVAFDVITGRKNLGESFSSGIGGGGKILGNSCPACGGSGKSPSSQDGRWTPDPQKLKIEELINQNFDKLSELEKKMGIGGSEIVSITKHKIETIGMDINDLPSTRIDKVGKMSVNAVHIQEEGVINMQRPSPVVEYVHVDDLPGGTFTQTIGNRYNMLVGAGGINFKSYGPVTVSGTITNIAGQQINIASENEICIDGGAKLQLTADIINIKQRENQQVVVEGNLGVTSNAIIGGGMHVEGELFVNHITAPVEIQQTQAQVVTGTTNNIIPKIIGYNALKTGLPIGYIKSGTLLGTNAGGPVNATPGGIPVFASSTGLEGAPPAPVWSRCAEGLISDPDCITMYSHSHTFKNLPLKLLKSNDKVRNSAKMLQNEGGERAPASPVNNAKK
jgi:hypothetical protein